MFGTTQKFQELAVSGSQQFNNRFNLLIRLLAEEGFEPPTRGFSDSASMGNRLLLAPCQNVASESFGRAKALGGTLGGFEGRVTAVGPVMTYSFSLGKLPVSTQWMWFHEFDVENRATGDAGFLNVSLPLSVGHQWLPRRNPRAKRAIASASYGLAGRSRKSGSDV